MALWRLSATWIIHNHPTFCSLTLSQTSLVLQILYLSDSFLCTLGLLFFVHHFLTYVEIGSSSIESLSMLLRLSLLLLLNHSLWSIDIQIAVSTIIEWIPLILR